MTTRGRWILCATALLAACERDTISPAPPDAPAILTADAVVNPRESRAEMYTIDEPSKTAMLSRDFESSPAVVTQIGGSVQRLPGGHTLVSFGTAGRVEEYNAAGQVVWHIDGNAGYVFRAQRVTSLYTPGVGTPR